MHVTDYINMFGLLFVVIILVPNVIFAVKCKDGFANKWNKKWVEIVEQVGRFGCSAHWHSPFCRPYYSCSAES